MRREAALARRMLRLRVRASCAVMGPTNRPSKFSGLEGAEGRRRILQHRHRREYALVEGQRMMKGFSVEPGERLPACRSPGRRCPHRRN